MKIFALNFLRFFNSAHFSWFKVDQIFTVHRFEHGKFRPVEISMLPCMVPVLKAVLFLQFYQCVPTV
jgi:hypothetical protein